MPACDVEADAFWMSLDVKVLCCADTCAVVCWMLRPGEPVDAWSACAVHLLLPSAMLSCCLMVGAARRGTAAADGMLVLRVLGVVLLVLWDVCGMVAGGTAALLAAAPGGGIAVAWLLKGVCSLLELS